MYFSSKRKSGLNLHLSKYQELSSGCRLHITCLITCVCARAMEKQWEIGKQSHFQYQSHSASPRVFPILRVPGKGKSGNRPPQEAVLLLEKQSRNTRNKTETLGSNNNL